jgi:hypothetical protein
MAGLLGIGLALVLGVGMRIAAATGSLLLVMMWSVMLPPANNPFLDEHLIEAAVLILLADVRGRLVRLRPLVGQDPPGARRAVAAMTRTSPLHKGSRPLCAHQMCPPASSQEAQVVVEMISKGFVQQPRTPGSSPASTESQWSCQAA